jgi:hypothetical protein
MFLGFKLILGSAAALPVLGLATNAAARQAPTVTYEKIVVLKIVPHLPVEKRTIETWSASSAPFTQRQIVTIARGPRLEIGTGPGHDAVLGTEQVNYLYDASTNTIYRTGFLPVRTGTEPTLEQEFKRVLAEPAVHLAGTRAYQGHDVYVVESRTPTVTGTTYVDELTFEPLLNDVRGTDIRTVVRTLVHKTLPATAANLARTSLTTAHPGAHTRQQAPPEIKQLYGEAAFLSGAHG